MSGAIFEWLDRLYDLDHYEVLRLEPTADADDIRGAYQAFAETFHPDAHGGRTQPERAAVDAIFKRGTEAYTVLGDPALRAEYDRSIGLAGAPQPRQKLSERVKNASVRPFVQRAEELVAKGELQQAKLQILVARGHAPNDDALAEYLHHIEEQLKKSR
jgi:curved DNA-binding protein CbpA